MFGLFLDKINQRGKATPPPLATNNLTDNLPNTTLHTSSNNSNNLTNNLNSTANIASPELKSMTNTSNLPYHSHHQVQQPSHQSQQQQSKQLKPQQQLLFLQQQIYNPSSNAGGNGGYNGNAGGGGGGNKGYKDMSFSPKCMTDRKEKEKLNHTIGYNATGFTTDTSVKKLDNGYYNLGANKKPLMKKPLDLSNPHHGPKFDSIASPTTNLSPFHTSRRSDDPLAFITTTTTGAGVGTGTGTTTTIPIITSTSTRERSGLGNVNGSIGMTSPSRALGNNNGFNNTTPLPTSNPLDNNKELSFSQNLGSFIESTIEGMTLAQNIPPTKPINAKMPALLSKFGYNGSGSGGGGGSTCSGSNGCSRCSGNGSGCGGNGSGSDGGLAQASGPGLGGDEEVANEDMIYKIKNRDTGEIYDLRDLPHTNEFTKLQGGGLILKHNNKAWEDWWAEKKRVNLELLTQAKYNNYDKCMELIDKKLGEFKADINCKGENDWTTLHFACLNGNYKLVNMLIYHGADVDAITTLKFTPLIIACQKNFEDIVNLLIISGSDINCQDVYKNTPLHYAAQCGYQNLVNILLQRPSINLNKRNNENKTAYELVVSKDIKSLFDIYLTERSLLSSKFMQKVPIHTTKTEYIKQMFNGVDSNGGPGGPNASGPNTIGPNANGTNGGLIGIGSGNSLSSNNTKAYPQHHQQQQGMLNSGTSNSSNGTAATPNFHNTGGNSRPLPFVFAPQINYTTNIQNHQGQAVKPPQNCQGCKGCQNCCQGIIGVNGCDTGCHHNVGGNKAMVCSSKNNKLNNNTPNKKAELEVDTKLKIPSYGNCASSANSNDTKLSSSSLNTSHSDLDVSNSGTGGSGSNGGPGVNTELEDKIKPSSFIVHSLIGKGSFGEVYLVEKKSNKTLYAMKVLDKSKVMKNNLVKYALTERNVLSLTNHPFIVKLNYAFQTQDKLFLILDYCPGGDLGDHLQKERRLSEDRARIYLAEIILALEDLHRRDIIFRDLKPDNIVLDQDGHAMLTDFGLSKEGVLDHTQGAKSFCGSVAYLAPEMLKRVGHGKAVDWYLLGVLFYEMLVGIPPYYANNREKLFENIEKAPLKIPASMTDSAKSLLKGLLRRNPQKRLGSGKGDAEEIKSHEFFAGVNWNDVYNRKLKPPIPEKKIRINVKVPLNVFDTSSTEKPSDKTHINGWSFVASNDDKTHMNHHHHHHIMKTDPC